MPSEASPAGADQDLGRMVEELKRELAEARDQQTATSEILGVISRSPTDVQPVFDAIAESSVRLCSADYGSANRLEGDVIHLVAQHGFLTVQWLETASRLFPHPLTKDLIAGAAMLEREVVHVEDMQNDARFPASQALARTMGYRTALSVPMLRDRGPVGAIVVFRQEGRPFTEAEIGLLRTFADQAVIAIENTRLFEEVQARTREMTQSLEYQTATSDVLNVISRSQTDVRPVFGAILDCAVRLCGADQGGICRVENGQLALIEYNPSTPEVWAVIREHYPRPVDTTSLTGKAVLEARVIHVPDLEAPTAPVSISPLVEQLGFRSQLSVPLLRAGQPIGVLALQRRAPGPFSPAQIALVETFADQAVIAIENARLFEEVQARNRDLTALGEVGRAVSSTLDLKVVLKTIVARAVELSGTDAGSIFYYRQEVGRFELGETSGLGDEVVARFRKLDIAAGQTGLGETIANRQPLQVADVMKRPSNALRDAALEAGLHAALIVPLMGSEGALGALVLQRRRTGEFPPSVVNLMQSFADQSAIALENARLFEEIARKSRELEIASQHKSQFVANMSHELRTPLAAILGYAELMQEGFYEPQGPKSLDALTRIRSNGKHLLGLINTVLDIAKIESGQFSLNMAEYAIDSVVETVRAATESLAETKKLALKTEVGKRLPAGLGDEQRLTQVLLNLVGNAIKFTDTGEVRITATAVNGRFTVAVTDTGPGIPPEELKRVFEQFHQIDNSNTKAKGGTGLGLAIAKQIVEMHGGRIWVESTLGKGAIFQMELPVRAAAGKGAA